MRRSGLAFAAAAVTVATTLVLGPSAATGPGGWDHVGHGSTATSASLNAAVTALNTDKPGVLYVGGNFTNAGGHANADRIAKWDGTSWSAIGATPITNGQVFAIASYGGWVWVGGTFQNAGGNPDADFLAAWTGSAWVMPCNSTVPGQAPFTGNVNALQIIPGSNKLWVGGSFQNGAGIARADYLLGCDLATGTPSPTVGSDGAFSGPVHALTADVGIENMDLYVGGGFTITDATPVATNVARYDISGGGVWHAVGSGPGGVPAVNTFVRSLTFDSGNLYIGTDATNVAGIPQADHVARWDGDTWHAVGADSAGTNGWFANGFAIDALATSGPILIAAGSFQNANGIATADDIAYFDGADWRPIGSNGAGNGPLSQHPSALGVTGGKVYVGGSFTSAGGDTLARFLAAYALRQPDNAISLDSGSGYVGDGVYSTTGSGEARTVSIRKGRAGEMFVKIQNDGLVNASFTVKATGGASGINDTYFRTSSGANITSAVRAGTYNTGVIAPRGTIKLRIRIQVSNTSASGTTFVVKTSSVAGTAPDAVRAIVKTFS